MGKIYDKLHNWLFPIDEHERDIVVVPSDDYLYEPFIKIVLDYLNWFGVDEKGNITNKRVYPTNLEILENRTALRRCGFSTGEYIEKLVISEFLEMKEKMPDLNPVLFAHFFEEDYHNTKLVKFTTLEAQKSNQTTRQYFDTIKVFLIEIQGFLEAEDLRVRIESIFTDTGNWGNYSRVEEFVTPFTKVQLNCDTLGKFSINYFINPHLKELVGESLGNNVEKWFDELVMGEMKDFIKMIPLNRRFDRYFEELVKLTKIYPNYKSIVTEKNSL